MSTKEETTFVLLNVPVPRTPLEKFHLSIKFYFFLAAFNWNFCVKKMFGQILLGLENNFQEKLTVCVPNILLAFLTRFLQESKSIRFVSKSPFSFVIVFISPSKNFLSGWI